MVTLNSMLEYRLDGRVVPEAMTGYQMLDEGWEPSKVIALHWDYFGASVDLRTSYGFAAAIVPNREYVAVLEETDATGEHSLLSVYASSGALVRSFRSLAEIIGGGQTGEFVGFEEPVSDLPTAFSPVFTRGSGTFQVDIDAASGAVLGIREVR